MQTFNLVQKKLNWLSDYELSKCSLFLADDLPVTGKVPFLALANIENLKYLGTVYSSSQSWARAHFLASRQRFKASVTRKKIGKVLRSQCLNGAATTNKDIM